MTINHRGYGVGWNAALETGGLLVSDNVVLEVGDQGRLTGEGTRELSRSEVGEDRQYPAVAVAGLQYGELLEH